MRYRWLLAALLLPLWSAAETLKFEAGTVTPGELSYAYWGIAELPEPVTIRPGMELVYEQRLSEDSIARTGGVDLTGGSVNNLRDTAGLVDGEGKTVRGGKLPAAWHERRFKLDPAAGKTFQRVDYFSSEIPAAAAGRYRAEIRALRLERPGEAPLPIAVTAERSPDKLLNMRDYTVRPRPPLPVGEVVFRSEAPRGDIQDFVMTALTPPGWSFDLPARSFLTYEVRLEPDSVNPHAAVNLMFDGYDLRSRLGDAFATDLGSARGKWVSRRIDLSPVGGARIREVLLLAGFHQMTAGPMGARFRKLRIVDPQGRELLDLTPKTGQLAYPLQHSARYAEKVRLEQRDLLGGRFRPERYLTDSRTPLKGTIYLHNFDPDRPQTATYALRFGDRTLAEGSVELPPGTTRELPVAATFAPAPGHYRPVLTLNGAAMPQFAVSVLTPEELARRPRAWAPNGAALGAVPMAGNGGGGIWNLPALREQGANYYQFRVEWSRVEPQPGVYDVSFVKDYLEMAEACGIAVQIDFYSGYLACTVPAWYRQYEMVTNLGRRHGGAFSPVAYWSPGHAAGLRAMNALYREALKSPAVISFNAWMGGNMDTFYGLKGGGARRELMDYSPYAQSAFVRYLREVRNWSLAEVNARYGLQLGAWSELTLPNPGAAPDLRPIWNDFLDFRHWSVGEMQRLASEAVRQLAPTAKTEYLYGGGLDTLRNGNDFNQAVVNCRKFPAAIHHTASPDPVNQMFLGAAKRQFGVPFSIETAGTPASVPDHQYAMYELLREGADGYTWIQSPGLLYRPSAAYGMGEYRQALERLAPAVPVRPQLAAIYSYGQQKVDFFGDLEEVRKAKQQAAAVLRHLEAAGYEVDLYTDETRGVVWAKYPVVIELGGAALSEALESELTTYVKNGGKLMLTGGSGLYTPGRPERRRGLLTALGVPELPTGQELLRQPCGRGEVWCWRTFPDLNAGIGAKTQRFQSRRNRSVYPNALDAALRDWGGVTPPVQTGMDDVYTALRRNGERWFLVIFNASPQRRVIPYRFALPAGNYFRYELVGRRPLPTATEGAGTVELPPYELAVEEWSVRPIEVPVYDAPPRHREEPPPEGTWFGRALAERITPVPELVVRPGLSYSCCRLQGGETLVPPLPGTGDYVLTAAAEGEAPELTITVDGKAETLRRSSSGVYRSGGLKLGRASQLKFPATDLRWVEFQPRLEPIPRIVVSPARSCTDGNYAGPEFRAPLPDFDEIRGVELTSATGAFDLGPTTAVRHPVAEVSWSVDAPEARESALALGCDYGLRLAVNGEEVFDSTRISRGAPFPREFLIPVKLKPGRNTFVGRVSAGSDGWKLWLEQLR